MSRTLPFVHFGKPERNYDGAGHDPVCSWLFWILLFHKVSFFIISIIRPWLGKFPDKGMPLEESWSRI